MQPETWLGLPGQLLLWAEAHPVAAAGVEPPEDAAGPRGDPFIAALTDRIPLR